MVSSSARPCRFWNVPKSSSANPSSNSAHSSPLLPTSCKMSADWQEMHLLHGKGFLIDTSTPRSSWLEAYIPDSDRPLVQTTIAEAIRTKGMFQLEHRVIRADGTIGWTSSRAVPFLDERGDIVEWLGAASDVTDRKRAEEVLRASEEALREADRRKDEFLAMLAHELRNPLAPIRTGLEFIRVAGHTPAAVERVRGMMDRQVGHMVRLIDDLLDVSRITSGKIQLQREPTPLNSLVTSAIEANRAAITAKNIALTVELPEPLCVVDVDPTRFVQVISNLLHNATKFSEEGGTIRLSGHVSGGDLNLPRQLTLSLADTGVGIPREFLPRVFELFSQAAGESSHSGLGIGLALAQRLVAMHGGAINVRSEGPGRGSEFVIRIPLTTRPVYVRPEEAIESHGIDCRVVVIDDNRDAAELMAMLVHELGGECRAAFDGESGLREVLTYRPDVVLLDIAMPGLDGYTTCRHIRSELRNEVLIVALTGYGQAHDKDASTRAGFDAHLTKPADSTALAKILRQRGASRTEPGTNATSSYRDAGVTRTDFR